ncbi:MAG: hypothetical protein AAFN18_17905 [Cyanobacteria bacterium J06554_6]
MTAVIAGSLGLGIGTAVRMQVVPAIQDTRLSPEQSFPPLSDWPPSMPSVRRRPVNRLTNSRNQGGGQSEPQRRLLPTAEAAPVPEPSSEPPAAPATAQPTSELLDEAIEPAQPEPAALIDDELEVLGDPAADPAADRSASRSAAEPQPSPSLAELTDSVPEPAPEFSVSPPTPAPNLPEKSRLAPLPQAPTPESVDL